MALIPPEEARDPTLTAQDKRSGYYYDGREIVLARGRGRPVKYRNKQYFNQDQKVEAATLYSVFGDFEQVVRILPEIPIRTLRQWKQEPWWIEIQKQVYTEQNEKLASKISETLDHTMAILKDRLENGDFKVNLKTGKLHNVPVDTRTLTSLFGQLSHHRTVVRGEPTSIKANIGVNDRLSQLHEAFVKFSKAKTVEGEVIEEDQNQDPAEGQQDNNKEPVRG